MRLYSLSLLAGTVLIQSFKSLPDPFILILLGLIVLVSSLFFKVKESVNFRLFLAAVLWFILGVLIAAFSSKSILENRIPTSLEGKDLLVTGKVIDIPVNREDGIRFRFKVSSATLNDKPVALKGIIRVGWYQDRKTVNAGEQWQFNVRLKRPSGFMNPGGFDYEKWLFTERIIATGYIRKSELHNTRISSAAWSSINHWRQKIHQDIQKTVSDKNAAAVLSALLVAVRNDLTDTQWQTFQKTGTSHLIAISGLHIAVVAALAFFPVWLIWQLFPRLNEKIPLRVAAGITSIAFATLYAILAGFTLPTQRALIMVIIGVLGLVLRQNYAPSTILAVALMAVLFLDPLAAMTISFWLSFAAVAFILFFIGRQVKKPLLFVIKLQLILSLLMLPLTLVFFGNASLVSPVANFFAIPYVSLLVVPISLLGLIFMPIGWDISDLFFALSSQLINWLLKALEWTSNLAWSSMLPAEIPVYLLIFALVGLLFLLLPKGFPARWLGIVFVLPALFFKPVSLAEGEFNYTMLDVGQGMATLLQTQNHTLVYDTGTKVSDSFDIGKLVLIPFLRSRGIDHIDTLMISHEDIDHRGGAASLLSHIPADKIISSDTVILPSFDIDECLADLKWQWDGVDFEILSPAENFPQNDNNRSCVLRVSNEHHSLLITGDIMKFTETYLLLKKAAKLKNDVITVPHHGSKTSSSKAFIEATQPELALVTAGYRSRFRHPNPTVINRYREQGIKVLGNVEKGAITVHFPANQSEITYQGFRTKKARFWNR